MLFGSLDAGNFITIDKTPAALWVMEVSARLFGTTPWSVLVPQALEGLGTVGLTYAAVRRWGGAQAGLVAAAVTALTPAAVASSRFNNPDTLLVLLLVGAAYATVRAVDGGASRWSFLAGALIGAGFLTKMLEAFIIVPALVAVLVLGADRGVARKARQLGCAAAGLVVAASWWVLIVDLTPPADRPYIGSTADNSLWDLMFGYDGLDRLTNANGMHLAQGQPGPGVAATVLRLFGTEMGSQISWLLPAAVFLACGAVLVARNGVRGHMARLSLVLWGGWLVSLGAVFSFGRGAINPYYTVALVPAIGALLGIGLATMWARRDVRLVRYGLAGSVAVTAVWSFDLLNRQGPWAPWVRETILVAGLVAALGLVAWPLRSWVLRCLVALALGFSVGAGPLAYDVGTAVNPLAGVDPYASLPAGRAQPVSWPVGGGQVALSRPGRALTVELRRGASGYRWAVATVGADPAAGYQLATGDPAMAIGGWSGTDPVPTLAEFKRLVSEHQVHYFIPAGAYGGIVLGRSYARTDAVQVTTWVEGAFAAQVVDGVTVYDLASRRPA
jgi:4-amino-4-deoxy-L-arabinose transferase-like glycosyltransferase